MAMSRSRGGVVVDDAVVDGDLAAGHALEPGDHPEDRALAAARRADQDAELAVADLEVDAVHDLELAILLDQSPDGHLCHRCLTLSPSRPAAHLERQEVERRPARWIAPDVDLVAKPPAVGQDRREAPRAPAGS